MSTQHAAQSFRVGLILHGNKIWISEFLGIIVVSITLFALFSLTISILIDEAIIYGNEKKLAALKNDSLMLSKNIVELSQKVIISDALKSFRTGNLPGQARAQLVDLVYNSSTAYGYDPFLLLAVINVESMFETGARGQYKNGDASGAYGLMQIKPETAQDIARYFGMKVSSIHDLFKPEINLALGVGYLTQLIAQFHSFKLGLLAYNQGPAVIHDYLSTNTPLSISYYNRVLSSYYQLKKSAKTPAPAEAGR
jgi:soluble lytic murein transglycosylase-like protein